MTQKSDWYVLMALLIVANCRGLVQVVFGIAATMALLHIVAASFTDNDAVSVGG